MSVSRKLLEVRMTRHFRWTKLFLLTVAALIGFTPALAQGQGAVIRGRVMSDAGQPLVGAQIYINDLAVSVGTNQAGAYTITLPAARLTGGQVNIRVRAIGYQPQLRVITLNPGEQTVDFSLKRDVTQLGEVVVTGVTTATEQIKTPF